MRTNMVFIVLSMFIFSSCKKDNNTQGPQTPKTFADFLKNTEWVGVLDRSGYQYAPPCCMRISAENNIVVYAPFFFSTAGGGFLRKDSLTGKVVSIDSLPDGTTSVKTTIDMLNEVTLIISDRKKLVSTSTNAAKPFPFQLELFTAKGLSIKNTTWSGPVITSGPPAGFFAYPDLSSIEFREDGTSVYYRNGQVVMANATPQLPTPGVLKVAYRQYGAIIVMSGFNETNRTIMDYFGVLLPDATKMMVHSEATGSRLPYYTQTIPWNGPIGVTPVILRQ